jgi:L-2,4-diaminobutyrate decarboxylase
VTRTFDLASWFARELEAAADFELATEPQANIVCFRVTPGGVLDLDALQLAVRDELVRSGAFYVVKTRLRNRVHLRTTIINARTDEADLRALMEAIRAAASRELIRRGANLLSREVPGGTETTDTDAYAERTATKELH